MKNGAFKLSSLTLLILFYFSLSAASKGSTLLAVGGGTPGVRKVDQASGAVTDLFNLTVSVQDLAAWKGAPGRFWAIGFPTAIRTSLTEFSAATGNPISAVSLNAQIHGLAIDPTDGKFFATTTSGLYQIDPVSGSLTLVGNTGLTGELALAFNGAGQAYGVAGRTLYSVDKSSGLATKIADIAGASTSSRFGFAFRPEDDQLFAIGDYANVTYPLYTINPADGTTAVIGASLVRPNGIAFVTIPEPTAFTLLCLGSVCLLRRR